MRRTRIVCRWLVALGIASLAVVSWYPFQLDVPRWASNGVTVLDDGTWRFTGPSLATTHAPPAWLHAAKEAGELEVRLSARTGQVAQDGPARLLSLSEDTRDQNLMIGQSGTYLVVRVRTAGGERVRAAVADVFADEGWRTIVVTIGDGTARIHVDGDVVAETTLRPFPHWADDHRLTLGNERAGGSRAWEGEIREASVRIDDRSVDLLTETDWDVPERVWYVPDRLRAAWARGLTDRPAVSLLHLAAAVAIGFVAIRAGRRPRIVVTATWWIVAVLVLNGGKVLVAERHPSLLTAALQVAGGLLGMWLAFRAVHGGTEAVGDGP